MNRYNFYAIINGSNYSRRGINIVEVIYATRWCLGLGGEITGIINVEDDQ